MIRGCFSVAVLAVLAQNVAVEPSSWPHLNGPDAKTRVVPTATWLTDLDHVKKLWQAKIGKGYSAVAIAEGKALTMGQEGGQETLHVFDAVTGAVLWNQGRPCALHPGFGASCTPTVAEGVVYVLGKEGTLQAFTLATGTIRWQRDLTRDEGLEMPKWGYASSPTILGEMIVVNAGSHGLALDRATGRTLWKSGSAGASYATVVPLSEPGQEKPTQVLILVQEGLSCVTLADGRERWKIPWTTQYSIHAATPVILDPQTILIASGYGTGAGMIRIADGKPELAWSSTELQAQTASPLVLNGAIYGISAHKGAPGELRCLDPKDGRVRWQQPGFGQGALIGLANQLLALTEKGDLVLVQADPEAYRELGRQKILDGSTWTQPSLADGRVYARNSAGVVVCFSLR